MAPSVAPSQEPASRSSSERPLLLRLYSCPHLVALVRLFGDRELDTADAERALKPLYEQFGKDRVLAACEELLDDRSDGKVVVFRLKGDVRQLAVQILGPVQTASSVPEGSPVPTVDQRAATSQPITPTVERKPETAAPSAGDPPHKRTAPTPPTPEPSASTSESSEGEHRGTSNFETFLIHFWLTGSDELCEYCMGLIEQTRDEAAFSEEVTEHGWTVTQAEIHYVAEMLRTFVEQEALTNRPAQAEPNLTRQTLSRVNWRELAKSILSDD